MNEDIAECKASDGTVITFTRRSSGEYVIYDNLDDVTKKKVSVYTDLHSGAKAFSELCFKACV